MQKKEMIAMILAGGQGSRLGVLTKEIAKPAVPFGGKYRIIDFPLSNCSNSGIDTVGVLTQYRPFALNSHIGIGTPWDLDRNNGGVSILPPYMRETGGDWYKGTANAIYQNINFIDKYDPEYVLILSGDHIYKMDYSQMLDFHKETNADATIAVIEVPLEEASRFGIMNARDNYEIYEFEEKPKHPKSQLASMGVYIFNWNDLRHFLIKDESDTHSSNDFGKNIIPTMLDAGKRMFAYPFKGYWKDVGTIESLWQANMDLLDNNNELNIHDRNWKIYSVSPTMPPQYVGINGVVKNSLITDGCEILGEVVNSILFTGVHVGAGAKVIDSVIMPNTKIKSNASVVKTITGSDVIIEELTQVGDNNNITVISEGSVIDMNSNI
jgi:glucose-1-phosphate adenylyltransferase